MSTKWTTAMTVKFVAQYGTHECLWNLESEDYKNRRARNSACAQIALAMGLKNFNVADVKNKIKNLRSTFNQEAKKVEASLQNENGSRVYKPGIKWYEMMRRILVDNVNDSTINAITCQDSIMEDESLSMDNHDDDSQIEVDCVLEYPTDEASTSENNVVEPIINIKRKKPDTIKNMQIKIPNKKIQMDDEFHFFGINVASQLRNLPIERALRLQVGIQSLLAEERISHSKNSLNGTRRLNKRIERKGKTS